MPHHKATKKRLKTDALKRLRNRSVKGRCRTLEKKFRAVLETGDKEKIHEAYREIQKALDQAAGHGILGEGFVQRKKSRLIAHLNRVTT